MGDSKWESWNDYREMLAKQARRDPEELRLSLGLLPNSAVTERPLSVGREGDFIDFTLAEVEEALARGDREHAMDCVAELYFEGGDAREWRLAEYTDVPVERGSGMNHAIILRDYEAAKRQVILEDETGERPVGHDRWAKTESGAMNRWEQLVSGEAIRRVAAARGIEEASVKRYLERARESLGARFYR